MHTQLKYINQLKLYRAMGMSHCHMLTELHNISILEGIAASHNTEGP